MLDPELPPLIQVVRTESTIKQMSRDGPRDPLGAYATAAGSKCLSPAKQVNRIHLMRKRLESVVIKAIVVK